MTSALDPDAAAHHTRVQVRSQQLLEAAARLMARDGSEAVSMQSVAREAGVSVGLIYRYFGGKDELLMAVIRNVLDAFSEQVPWAIEGAGEDPVRQLTAAFATYCAIINVHRHAAALTYRETKALSHDARDLLKELEVSTSDPLRAVLRSGQEAGIFDTVDIELTSYNMLLLAHAWALKHWYFERTLGFDEYVARQTAAILRSILLPKHRRRYRDLLT